MITLVVANETVLARSVTRLLVEFVRIDLGGLAVSWFRWKTISLAVIIRNDVLSLPLYQVFE